MRCVWSFWTKPLLTGRGWTWATPYHHLLAWILSVETARRHYPRTTLVADDAGATLLIDRLGLEFERVSTELNDLDEHDPEWWNLGKLVAYGIQSEPFVHIDQDVFLWEPLPARLVAAPVFAQNPEPFSLGTSAYRPQTLEHAIYSSGGWVPDEMAHSFPVGGVLQAACCGILGGQRVDFIAYYADLALRLVDHPLNRDVWPRLGDKQDYTIVLEQYLVEACAKFHRGQEDSPFRDISIEYLFDSPGDAWARSDEVGFTHLMGGAKRDAGILERLERRVRVHYPARYERCRGLAPEEMLPAQPETVP